MPSAAQNAVTDWLLAANRWSRSVQRWVTGGSEFGHGDESDTMASSGKGTNAIHDKLHVNYVIHRARTNEIGRQPTPTGKRIRLIRERSMIAEDYHAGGRKQKRAIL